MSSPKSFTSLNKPPGKNSPWVPILVYGVSESAFDYLIRESYKHTLNDGSIQKTHHEFELAIHNEVQESFKKVAGLLTRLFGAGQVFQTMLHNDAYDPSIGRKIRPASQIRFSIIGSLLRNKYNGGSLSLDLDKKVLDTWLDAIQSRTNNDFMVDLSEAFINHSKLTSFFAVEGILGSTKHLLYNLQGVSASRHQMSINEHYSTFINRHLGFNMPMSLMPEFTEREIVTNLLNRVAPEEYMNIPKEADAFYN
ncbi:MAG: hypothetical protein SFT81_07390 [Candidatus Caenarcaniphilales bacterium]|nr:hypothetical protein [Candidatus Caenarcaniphilales bacterium]